MQSDFFFSSSTGKDNRNLQQNINVARNCFPYQLVFRILFCCSELSSLLKCTNLQFMGTYTIQTVYPPFLSGQLFPSSATNALAKSWQLLFL